MCAHHGACQHCAALAPSITGARLHVCDAASMLIVKLYKQCMHVMEQGCWVHLQLVIFQVATSPTKDIVKDGHSVTAVISIKGYVCVSHCTSFIAIWYCVNVSLCGHCHTREEGGTSLSSSFWDHWTSNPFSTGWNKVKQHLKQQHRPQLFIQGFYVTFRFSSLLRFKIHKGNVRLTFSFLLFLWRTKQTTFVLLSTGIYFLNAEFPIFKCHMLFCFGLISNCRRLQCLEVLYFNGRNFALWLLSLGFRKRESLMNLQHFK